MSDDVITLDSSDEESRPESKKPKNMAKKQRPPKKPGKVYMNPFQNNVGKNNTVKMNIPIITPQGGLMINGPNPFSHQIGNELSHGVIRPIEIKPRGPNMGRNPIIHNIIQSAVRQSNPNMKKNFPVNLPFLPSIKNPRYPFPKLAITNPRSLAVPKIVKKPTSQNVINALPAGITVTRTSSQSKPKKPLVLPTNLVVKRTPTRTRTLPSQSDMILTVNLDDDDDDVESDRVDSKIPVEFEVPFIKETRDDTKENDASIVIEIPPIDLWLDPKKSDESIENAASDHVSNESSEKISEDGRKTNISFYTPKKNIQESQNKDTKLDIKPMKTIDSTTAIICTAVECTNDNAILDAKPKEKLETENVAVSEPTQEKEDSILNEQEKIPDDSNVVESCMIEEVKSPEIPGCIIPSPSTSKPEDPPIDNDDCLCIVEPNEERASSPVIKSTPVVVKINMKPSDVEFVEEFIKNSPKKDPTPVLESDRQIGEKYQKFIDLCFKLDPSDDMKKIIDKKVKGYYMSVNPSFTESRSFCKYVDGKIADILRNPGSLFLYIKDVVDELKVRRVKNKKGSSDKDKSPDRRKPDEENEESAEEENNEDEVVDTVADQRIRKLERAMHKLNKAIKKLEEREVGDDDEEDSAYLQADRYKSRLIRIYQKLCTLTGERDEARRVSEVRGLSRLTLCGGRLPRLAAAVRALASSRPHWFPDYTDVYSCVEHCAREQGLIMRPDELQQEAREAFIEIGTLLQQRRREREYEELSFQLGAEPDPAEADATLAAELQKNRKLSMHREMEVLNEYANKQSNLKLVAELVPDAEADKSEGSDQDSDEEDILEQEVKETSAETNENNPKSSSNKDDQIPDTSKEGAVDEENDTVKVKADNEINDNCSNSSGSKLTELCNYLQLERQPSKERTETSMKRKRDDSNEDSDNSSSSFSLIEVSSSDSQDSIKSSRNDTSNRDFKRLKLIRPSSVMSGINLIDDLSSKSSSMPNTEAIKDPVIIMEVDDSNDNTITNESRVPADDDDNATSEVLPKENNGNKVKEKFETSNDTNPADTGDRTDAYPDAVINIEESNDYSECANVENEGCLKTKSDCEVDDNSCDVINETDDIATKDSKVINNTDNVREIDSVVINDTDNDCEVDSEVINDTDNACEVDSEVINDTDNVCEIDSEVINDTDNACEVDSEVINDTDNACEVDSVVINGTDIACEIDSVVINDTDNACEIDSVVINDTDNTCEIDSVVINDTDDETSEKDSIDVKKKVDTIDKNVESVEDSQCGVFDMGVDNSVEEENGIESVVNQGIYENVIDIEEHDIVNLIT